MSPKRILVVDDSALIRQVISDAFRPAGHLIDEAADGRAALEKVRESIPDLIIADILMPVMDGWALCHELRREPAFQDIPFIFLTTERDVPKRIKGLEMGADDYLCKPFSKEELVARAERLMHRAGRLGEAVEESAHVAAPRAAALAGHTDQIPMPDLLQMLSMNGKSGTLNLSGESIARVYFREGHVINAETQGLKGEKALFRIMAWTSARFDFEPGEPAREIESALKGSTSSVLMEGFAHLDELHDLIASLPPRGRLLRVPPALASSLEGMNLTTAQRIILQAAGPRGATLDRIVDTVPERDLEAYTAVHDLLRRGLLEAIEDLTASL
jgi:CheY-like chemotaxis protein